MQKALAFDDVLIRPKFSTIQSRRDVDLSSLGLKLPIISSNMDTITESAMAKAMNKAGGVGCLHRFMSIEDNVKMFKESEVKPWVSIGLGDNELERAIALFQAGAFVFVIDVAHGASLETVQQFRKLFNKVKGNAGIIVGNFGDLSEIRAFEKELSYTEDGHTYAYKVGIGGGSACTTRIETGCGVPTLEAVWSCRHTGLNIIADGGMRTPGDIAKAIAVGANAVMLGGMLAGTYETPGETVTADGTPCSKQSFGSITKVYKKYRGSASKESYLAQGKDESWRTAEGESFTVPYKGLVENVLQRIEGGLRSSYSYCNSSTTEEFQHNAELIEITSAGYKESGAHGKI